jgi:tetratricopeptide (TPR) repeat protein
MGTALGVLGRYEEAIGYFDTILLYIDPNYVPALVSIGTALENLGRHQEAIEYFEAASLIQEPSVSAAPISSDNKNHFVLITDVGEKDYSTNSGVLRYYSNLDVGNSQVHNLNGYKERYELHYISHGYKVDVDKEFLIGYATFNKQDYDGAIIIFDEILGLNAMHPDELVKKQQLAASLYHKGLSLENLGDLPTAQQYKSQALDVDPNYNGGLPAIAKFAAPTQLIVGVPPLL